MPKIRLLNGLSKMTPYSLGIYEDVAYLHHHKDHLDPLFSYAYAIRDRSANTYATVTRKHPP